MKLNKAQSDALKAILKWVKAKNVPWMFTLAGYAGTGKTTLLQSLIGELGDRYPFICCAPTGKAASVLRGKVKGLVVKTVHQVLYVPQGQNLATLERLEAELMAAKADDGPTTELKLLIREERQRLSKEQVSFSVKPSSSIVGKLVIVDEASMISSTMLEDFEASGCKALFVGDSGQLPPVKSASWFIEHKHDAMLVNIVRQALESPIIRLSMQVRAGEVKMEEFKEGDCFITTRDKVPQETWKQADQVLTGSNDSRRHLNRYFRKQLGLNGTWVPQKGEKMICLKNDHYKLPPWINGIQFTASNCACDPNSGQTHLEASYDGDEIAVELYPYHCQVHYDQRIEEEPRESRKGLFEADFAYAITVHKSQGSEWPFVIVADDGIQLGNKEFRKRWLYTAVTRAKEKFILVRK